MFISIQYRGFCVFIIGWYIRSSKRQMKNYNKITVMKEIDIDFVAGYM